MSLLQRARDTMHRHALLRDGRRVLVALSGGADSVALLLILKELEADGLLTVAGAAHLNHQLRGADADQDEAFCATLAQRLGVPFVSERIEVAATARAQKRSIEDAARSVRYAFLDRAANSLCADAIAVAHTREDQAETFLLRLMRGAGTRGLAAIRPRAGRVIRPLLDVDRAALRDYLAARDASFREDLTNADVEIPRNRVRHELIPYLRSHFSPGVTDVLARAAELARQDEDFLQAEAIKLAARVVLSDVTVRLDVSGLTGAPRALSSRVVQTALQRFAGPKSIHFDHVDRLLALAADPAGGEGGAVSLPGQTAVRVGDTIVLRPAAGSRRNRQAAEAGEDGLAAPKPRRGRVVAETGEGGLVHRSAQREGGNSFAFLLSIPGEVRLGSQAVGAERLPGLPGAPERQRKWAGRGDEVGVAADTLTLPLGIRSRRPGDKFRPLGAPGRRKLQDFLVDRKVRREDRDTVPLVVDGQDRIVWVVGQSVAEDFRVTDPSQGVILLKVRHLGGVG
jgi:tRNA(Ile)-lysidine synthase